MANLIMFSDKSKIYARRVTVRSRFLNVFRKMLLKATLLMTLKKQKYS